MIKSNSSNVSGTIAVLMFLEPVAVKRLLTQTPAATICKQLGPQPPGMYVEGSVRMASVHGLCVCVRRMLN